MKISEEELYLIVGGGIGATFLNALSRFTTTIYAMGQSIGSSIRRAKDGKVCPV